MCQSIGTCRQNQPGPSVYHSNCGPLHVPDWEIKKMATSIDNISYIWTVTDCLHLWTTVYNQDSSYYLSAVIYATSYFSFLDRLAHIRPESKWSRTWSWSRYFQAGFGFGSELPEIRRLRSPACLSVYICGSNFEERLPPEVLICDIFSLTHA